MTSSSVSCESKLNGSIASYRTNFFGGFRSSQASASAAAASLLALLAATLAALY